MPRMCILDDKLTTKRNVHENWTLLIITLHRDLYVGVRLHTKYSRHATLRSLAGFIRNVLFWVTCAPFYSLAFLTIPMALRCKWSELIRHSVDMLFSFFRYDDTEPQQSQRTHSIFDAWHERTIPLSFIVLFDNLIISNYFHGIHN